MLVLWTERDGMSGPAVLMEGDGEKIIILILVGARRRRHLVHQVCTQLMADWKLDRAASRAGPGWRGRGMNIAESSAKRDALTDGGMPSKMSLMKAIKRRGARTEPWGTPRSHVVVWDVDDPCVTDEGRSEINE
jgi:hypothetical protein